MTQKQRRIDGRHKLAVLGSLVCWALSVYFSKIGFSVGETTMLWVGWILALIVTIVELVFNSPTHNLSLTLLVVGIICYAYGIWTNVSGFWAIQHPTEPFVPFSMPSIMSWFVGFILEVLPEPLLMWGIDATFDGDFLGNLAGLFSGDLPYAQPGLQQNLQNQKPFVPTPAFMELQKQHGKQNKNKQPNQRKFYPKFKKDI